MKDQPDEMIAWFMISPRYNALFGLYVKYTFRKRGIASYLLLNSFTPTEKLPRMSSLDPGRVQTYQKLKSTLPAIPLLTSLSIQGNRMKNERRWYKTHAPNADATQFKPLKNYILVRRWPSEEQSDVIIAPQEVIARNKSDYADVISAGPDCRFVTQGMAVVLENEQSIKGKVMFGGELHLIVSELDLAGTVESNSPTHA